MGKYLVSFCVFVCVWAGMDYRTGLPGTGPGAHEVRGPLSQSLCVKSLLCRVTRRPPEKTLSRRRGRGHLHVKKMVKLCGREGARSACYTLPRPLPLRRSVLLFTNSNLREGEGAPG